MKKLQECVMRDIGWKLLSVMIAMVLWFMVINIEHPVDTRSYNQLIQFENEEVLTNQGLTIRGKNDLENTKVIIKVKAQRTALDRLSQYKSAISATVDLQKLEGYASGDTVPVSLNVKLPEGAGTGFEIVGKTPAALDLTLENLVSSEYKVTASVSGGVASGYQLSEPSVTPEKVTVSGAESIVSTVTEVKAVLNIDDLDADAVRTADVYAYDKNGAKVEGVKISPKQVKVSLSVLQNKKIPVEGKTVGLPASGYVVGTITTNPQTIEVKGAKKDLNRISELTLPEVNVRNESESVTESFRTEEILPEGLTMGESAPAMIQVNVDIQPEAKRRVLFPTAHIIVDNLKENLKLEFSGENIGLEVQGPAPFISTLTESSITVRVDLAGMDAGQHNVPLQVTFPDGIMLSGTEPAINVKLTETISEDTTPAPEPDIPVMDEPTAEGENDGTAAETPAEPETDDAETVQNNAN